MEKIGKLENNDKLLIKSYISNLLDKQVIFLEDQIEGLIYEENIEFLHHTRVMLRRVRNTIFGFSPFIGKKNSNRWLLSMKALTKSLTRSRDLDVQISFLENEMLSVPEKKYLAGLQRLHLRKIQKRDQKQESIRAAILQFEKDQSLSEIKEFIIQNPFDLENFSPPEKLKQVGKETIEKLTKECFSYVPFIANPDQVEYLHGLRIAIKNLRYSVELFQPIYPELDSYLVTFKQFQDDLGLIHDYDVWLLDLEKFMMSEKQKVLKFYGQTGPFNFIKPGIEYLTNDIKTRKIDVHSQFLEKWNYHFQNQFWTNLQIVFEDSQSTYS